MKLKMIWWQAITAAVLLAGMLAGCRTLISGASVSTRDWQFVQSVGGIAVGVPVHAGNRVHLPIRCNVSGAETITIRRTTINSALVCRQPRV